MRAKTAVMLCEASFVAGALLAKPMARKARCQGQKAVNRSARGYVRARAKARELGEKTGKPGLFAALAVAFAAHAARDGVNRWWEAVDDAEHDVAAEKADKFGMTLPPDPPTTIEEYIGSPS